MMEQQHDSVKVYSVQCAFFTPGLQSAFLTFGLPSAFYPQSVYMYKRM